MRTQLRRWIRSWRVWVAVGCVVFLAVAEGVPRRFPVVTSWPLPLSVWVIIIGLEYIAKFTVGIILFYALTGWLNRLFKPYLEKVPFGARSDKAKEKMADSMMSTSTAMYTATSIGLFVFPSTAFLNAMVSGTDPLSSLMSFVQAGRLEGWTIPILLCLFCLPAIIGLRMRLEALDIYDEVYRASLPPDVPTVNSTAQRTREPPTVQDSGPPVYIKANMGTRRHGRHRAK